MGTEHAPSVLGAGRIEGTILRIERFCRANVRANFCLTSRKAKLRANVRSFERESCRKRETNFRSNFRSLWTAGQPGAR